MKASSLWVVAVATSFLAPGLSAQESAFQRLPIQVLDVTPPSEWVRGVPGEMVAHAGACRDLPGTGVRRRIVDIAVQEWGFFGFPVLDRVDQARLLPPGAAADPDRPTFESAASGRPPLLGAEESARVATSIAGYWAVTREGAGIIADQNRAWNGGGGVGVRWRSPWSAAFISWVMCEAGLGTADRFQRAIAHRTYIDQAIRARDGQAPQAAFVAHDIGEETVEPGDLLCTGRQPSYRNIAERRRQMGVGARSHCDIVVEVDEEGERIFAIGGNVLRAVSLKVLPAVRDSGGEIRPLVTRGSSLFAHLKLQADPTERNTLRLSPTFDALLCGEEGEVPSRITFVASALTIGTAAGDRC